MNWIQLSDLIVSNLSSVFVSCLFPRWCFCCHILAAKVVIMKLQTNQTSERSLQIIWPRVMFPLGPPVITIQWMLSSTTDPSLHLLIIYGDFSHVICITFSTYGIFHTFLPCVLRQILIGYLSASYIVPSMSWAY